MDSVQCEMDTDSLKITEAHAAKIQEALQHKSHRCINCERIRMCRRKFGQHFGWCWCMKESGTFMWKLLESAHAQSASNCGAIKIKRVRKTTERAT